MTANRIKNYLIALLAVCSFSGNAQGDIQWLTWEEAAAASKIEKRKYMIEIYTDWCKVCKNMEATSFTDPKLVNYIHDNYYPIRFDAEKKEFIIYKGKQYSFGDAGFRGYHQLAVLLSRGQLSFPTLVFLDEDMNVLQPIPGYQSSDMLTKITSYFAKDYHQKLPWKKFLSKYYSEDKAVETQKSETVSN